MVFPTKTGFSGSGSLNFTPEYTLSYHYMRPQNIGWEDSRGGRMSNCRLFQKEKEVVSNLQLQWAAHDMVRFKGPSR